MGNKRRKILEILEGTLRKNLRTRAVNWLGSGGRIAEVLEEKEGEE